MVDVMVYGFTMVHPMGRMGQNLSPFLEIFWAMVIQIISRKIGKGK
jgi:hypothetical protein